MTRDTEKKGHITLGLITSWGLGTLFLLMGLAMLFTPTARDAASVFLLIAILIFPPIRNFVHLKTGKSLSTGVRVVSFLILTAWGGTLIPDSMTSNSAAQIDPTLAAIEKGVVVEVYSLRNGAYDTKTVTGTIRNRSNKQLSYVGVEFNLYDNAGNQIGNTLTNITHLEPGGTWNFEAPVLETRATQAKLKEITSF